MYTQKVYVREEKLKILCDIHDVMKIRCDFREYLSCFDHVENDDEWWLDNAIGDWFMGVNFF